MAKFLAYRRTLSVPDDDVSTDADIWMFAEDLLNFVFRNHAGFPIKPKGEDCRRLVIKGFSNTVKSAIEITQRKLSTEIDVVFNEMSKKDDVTEAYCKYVTHLRKVLRSGGFDGSQFIHYCVFVAYLGEKFYRTGLRDFHFQAFAAVRRGFKKTDMSNGGWNILESAAEAITAVEEPVETPRKSAPSPDVEPSALDDDEDQRYIDGVFKDLLSDNDCLSDSSEGSEKSIGKAKSVESLSIRSVSDDESERVKSADIFSRALISPRKRPAQSRLTSSSSETLKFPTLQDSFLKSYSEKSDTDTSFEIDNFHNKIIDLQDLTKHSDPNESYTELHLNKSNPEHLSPSDQVVKRNKTESKKVDIHSENSRDSGNSQKENEIPSDWSFSLPMEQVSKPNFESRRLPIFCELSAKAQEPNSTESSGNPQKENEIPSDWSFTLPVEEVSKPNSESRRLSVFSELSAKAQEPNSTESSASASKSSEIPRFKSF